VAVLDHQRKGQIFARGGPKKTTAPQKATCDGLPPILGQPARSWRHPRIMVPEAAYQKVLLPSGADGLPAEFVVITQLNPMKSSLMGYESFVS
jgi:hypothetical protein